MDLKYVNKTILLFKVGNVKVPAYALVWFIIWLALQNRYAFFIFILMFVFSIYMETNNETLKTIKYKFLYIFQDRMLFSSKSFHPSEELQK